MARGRERIPGVTPDAERVINGLVLKLEERIRALERRAGRPGVVSSSTSAVEGEFLNIEAPAGGLTIILPRPTQALRNERITLNFRNENPVRIVSVLGLVNRAQFVISNQVGTFDAVCDGLDGWSVELGLTEAGPSGGSLDAEYLVGAAHASLPNGRVATASAEITPDVSTPNVVSWALNAASVAFSKLADLTGLSVLGRAANSAGVMAAITATAARQTLRVNDAGTALEWGHPVEVRDSGADQGDAFALDFVAGTNVNLAASVAAGIATITPSVDLSSVTYTAGDGIDLVANQFSVDVSDFQGAGLENDGSNNLRIAHIAAESFFGRFAAIAGAPAARAGNDVAGDGLTYSAGGTLAVGAGSSMQANANDVAYVGTSSDVVLNAISGAQGVVDISSLACGGRVGITAPTGAWSIAGFTAKSEGFWFILTVSNTVQTGTILNEASAASTDVRCPGHVSFSANRSMQGLMMYGAFGAATRWLFIPGAIDPPEMRTQLAPLDFSGGNAWTGDHTWTGTLDWSADITGSFFARCTTALELESVNDDVRVTAGINIELNAANVRLGPISGAGAFMTIDGGTASTPGVGAGDGMFWVLDPGSPSTRPQYTDDANVDCEILVSGPVQTFATGGTSNNVALNDKTRILRVDTGGTNWVITGFAGTLWDGRELTVVSASNSAVTGQFSHLTGSAAGQQIVCAGNANFGPTVRCSGHFVYDGTDSVWRMTASNTVV